MLTLLCHEFLFLTRYFLARILTCVCIAHKDVPHHISVWNLYNADKPGEGQVVWLWRRLCWRISSDGYQVYNER